MFRQFSHNVRVRTHEAFPKTSQDVPCAGESSHDPILENRLLSETETKKKGKVKRKGNDERLSKKARKFYELSTAPLHSPQPIDVHRPSNPSVSVDTLHISASIPKDLFA